VVLKRLEDAIADRDHIYALILSSAVNQDGPSSGLTAPNGPSQEAVIRAALKRANVTPAQVGYVETHGTGTALGDPIEVQALGAVLGEGRPADKPLMIGSIKTNLGHLEAAAGVGAMLKAVLVLQHRQIPPHLHFKTPNPYIPFDRLPIVVPTELTPWPASKGKLIAGVSAFGFSGTNVHAILEEAPAIEPVEAQGDRPLHILALSAKSGMALKELAGRYERHLEKHPSLTFPDVCFTANAGRSHLDHRFAALAHSAEQVRGQLAAFAGDKEPTQVLSGLVQGSNRPKVAFLFTGQGSQYVGMGQRLFHTQPTFRKALQRCNEILGSHLERPLLSVLFPGEGQSTPLDETGYTQPALFAIEYALTELWRSWGINPSVVMGHSVGEYVAACVAGVFGLQDGLKLIATRGRLMQKLPRCGQMAAVFADEASVAAAIEPYQGSVSIAAVNGPENIVISGAGPDIEKILRGFETDGIGYVPLNVSHAFHSPLMEPILDEFERVAAEVAYSSPRIGVISNVTGTLSHGEEMANGAYWRRHIRQPVRFSASMAWLYGQGYRTFLEIGPSPVLLGMGAGCLPESASAWLPSLKRGEPDWQRMLTSLAELYVRGAEVGWNGFDRDYPRRRLPLPTYPFQRKRYWIVEDAFPKEQDNLFYEIQWLKKEENPDRSDKADGGCWLIFSDRKGTGEALSVELAKNGQKSVLAFAGEAYRRLDRERFTINPDDPEQIRNILEDLPWPATFVFCGIVHLWSLDAPPPEEVAAGNLEASHVTGCGTIMHLVQKLALKSWPKAPRVWIVTKGAQSVTKDEQRLNIFQAPIWGIGRTIALEYREYWGGMLDLDPERTVGEDAMLMCREICSPDSEDQVAFRARDRFVARLVRKNVARLNGTTFQCRPDCSYLITGGLGGIGLQISRMLVEKGARKLILIGRTTFPPRSEWTTAPQGSSLFRKIAVIRELEAMGASIRIASVDVADEYQLGSFLETCNSGGEYPIRGLVHAAGVIQHEMLADHDIARMNAVMRPKLVGGWRLHKAFEGVPLDFFVMFSSASSVLNSPFLGSYAAGNAFLDALAHFRKRRGLPGLSINWGPWAESGMAVDSMGDSQKALKGVKGISNKQGLGALERLIQQDSAQVAVMAIDWLQWRSLYPEYTASPFLENVVEGHFGATTRSGQDEATKDGLLRQLEETSPGRRKRILLDHVGSLAAQVLGLTAWQSGDYSKPLRDMGLDSLMAVELSNRLGSAVTRKLPATLLFLYPTIEEVTDYLAIEMPSLFQATGSLQPPGGESGPEQDVLADIEHLSEEDVDRLFREQLSGES
jgi:malonyl CoA-acyl carrier protein transacylase